MKLAHVFEAGYGLSHDLAARSRVEEPPEDRHELYLPYSLADSTPIKLRLKVYYQDYGDSIELNTIQLLAVVMPDGKEVPPQVAQQQMGEDDADTLEMEHISEWTVNHLKELLQKQVNYVG